MLGTLFAVFTAGVTLGQSQLYANYLAPLLFSLDKSAIEVDENKNI